MKILILDIRLQSDCQFYYEVVPVGTLNPNCGDYIYHDRIEIYHDEDFSDCIEKYKKVIRHFCNNIVENGHEECVRDNLTAALNKNWNKGFCVEDGNGDWNISVKFSIEDRDERTPYTFYVTEEQMDDIDSLMYTIHGHENMTDGQLQDAVLNKMITAIYKQESDKYNQRKDGSYDRQDLLDALDELTDGSYDGAAYNVIEGFIKDYFNGYI